MSAENSRLAFIDALKAIASQLIVLHHLAFYGPMSDYAHPLAPEVFSWLSQYARIAVQAFLVIGGFLAVKSIAPSGHFVQKTVPAILWKRYLKLVPPYVCALLLAIAAAPIAESLTTHESIPAPPTAAQFIAHVFLLQSILGFDGLSAGVWYIAIDFQLFVLTVLGLALARWAQQHLRMAAPLGAVGVLGLVLASLLYFNLDSTLDDTALYFFGSYGLGMLAFWAGRSGQARGWLVALALVGLVALLAEFRSRIATAVAVALWLGAATAWPRLQEHFRGAAWLRSLGQMSYSVFLIHFPVCLLVNAVVHEIWPHHPWINLLGMAAAFGLSLGAGALLYRYVETRPWSERVRDLLPGRA